MGLTDVSLRFLVKGEGLEKLDSINRQLTGLSATTAKVMSLFKTAAGAAVGGYGMMEAYRAWDKTATSMKQLASQADRLQMTTQALGGLQYAAKMSGVELGEFNGDRHVQSHLGFRSPGVH